MQSKSLTARSCSTPSSPHTPSSMSPSPSSNSYPLPSLSPSHFGGGLNIGLTTAEMYPNTAAGVSPSHSGPAMDGMMGHYDPMMPIPDSPGENSVGLQSPKTPHYHHPFSPPGAVFTSSPAFPPPPLPGGAITPPSAGTPSSLLMLVSQ